MKTKIILEFGCNHQGDYKIAEKMIDEASKLGVWGVKFQKRYIDGLADDLKIKPRDLSNSFGKTYYEHRKALEFEILDLAALQKHAENKGLIFCCTAFDEYSIHELSKNGCKLIKLPSQLYTDLHLKQVLEYYKNSQGLSVAVSTGMHNLEEIENSDWIEDADIFFHCISAYPFPVTEANLETIRTLCKYRKNIGYSSHENEGLAIPAAVLCGAEYIERHFTLDKSMKGSDHSTVSSDVQEMEKIISDIKHVERMLGDSKRKIGFREEKIKGVYRA